MASTPKIKNIFSLGELFEKVQLQKIFPDGKTFVDCTSKNDLTFIRERYEYEKGDERFDLSKFVQQYFEEPKTVSSGYKSDIDQPLDKHIEMLWDVLTRQPEAVYDSTIFLPQPYIVPGGRFREIYYWDSYFTMLGLQVSRRFDMIRNMIDNFAYLVDLFGYIPNGNRTYYVGRSQPPFFACMVNLFGEEAGPETLKQYLPHLEKEYEFWMKGAEDLNDAKVSSHRAARLPDGSILNHYWDEHDSPRPEAYRAEVTLAASTENKNTLYRHLRAACESGWDFSSRWFRNANDFSTIHASDIIPVDLNCLLFNLENTIAKAYETSGDTETASKYLIASENRKKAIEKYCWNNEKGFYFDYDYVESVQKNSMTLASVSPLFFQMSTTEQAQAVANNLEKHFLKPGGLISTTETTGQQWDAPNGWAPLQWMSIAGLKNYDIIPLAKEIAKRWMSINEKVYRDTGKIMEKYNVVDIDITAGGGEYKSQDGFGWSNGVYLALKKWMKESDN